MNNPELHRHLFVTRLLKGVAAMAGASSMWESAFHIFALRKLLASKRLSVMHFAGFQSSAHFASDVFPQLQRAGMGFYWVTSGSGAI